MSQNADDRSLAIHLLYNTVEQLAREAVQSDSLHQWVLAEKIEEVIAMEFAVGTIRKAVYAQLTLRLQAAGHPEDRPYDLLKAWCSWKLLASAGAQPVAYHLYRDCWSQLVERVESDGTVPDTYRLLPGSESACVASYEHAVTHNHGRASTLQAIQEVVLVHNRRVYAAKAEEAGQLRAAQEVAEQERKDAEQERLALEREAIASPTPEVTAALEQATRDVLARQTDVTRLAKASEKAASVSAKAEAKAASVSAKASRKASATARKAGPDAAPAAPPPLPTLGDLATGQTAAGVAELIVDFIGSCECDPGDVVVSTIRALHRCRDAFPVSVQRILQAACLQMDRETARAVARVA